MNELEASARSLTLNQAAELLAGEPQWIRDGVVPGGRMSDKFMKAYGFLLSAVASGELRARGPDNPDAEEIIIGRELCWDWVIEEHHLLSFLERRRACANAFSSDHMRLESVLDSLAVISPWRP
jgi:hypothetical protein